MHILDKHGQAAMLASYQSYRIIRRDLTLHASLDDYYPIPYILFRIVDSE
ncbi:hypothetical protein [Ktedonosporobacter rubrisoli]|nr:hypothetical protein [Ktedonosporobacter rubrisoli]